MRSILAVLLVTYCIFHSSELHGQVPISSTLDKHFSKYEVGSMTSMAQRSTSQAMSWQIDIGDLTNQEAVLFENNLFSPDYIISTSEESSMPLVDMPKTYSGYLMSDPTSKIRLTIYDGLYSAYVQTEETTYYIEPVSNITNEESRLHVLYDERDVKQLEAGTCAASQVHKKSSKIESSNFKMSGCRTYQLAIALDFGYQQKHGGTSGAIAQSTAVMNMVAGDYASFFADEVRFEIVEHWVSTCSACDPWTSSSNVFDLLDSFTSWAPSGFNRAHDIGQFWTDRDVFGVDASGRQFRSTVGLAWLDVVCRNFRYHVLEDFTSTNWGLRVLTSHELGHNFSSDHDANGTSFIMSPSVQNTATWSSASRNQINNALSRHNCFTACSSNSNCNNLVTLSNPVSSNMLEARQSIRTNGTVQITQDLHLSAPDIQINSISVFSGAELTMDSDGCN